MARHFVASQLSLEKGILALNICRGPTGFWGGLYAQIFAELYLFYMILYLTFFKNDRLKPQQHYMGPGIAKLYHDHIFWWFGLPTKIISDRDLRFTLHFSKALMTRLGIEQNISMAFHPQVDGLLERKNQWIEQYLRLITSAAPEDWMQWLVLALAVHNNQRNTTMGLSPNQVLLGYEVALCPENLPLMLNKLAKEQYHVMMK
jgi:hypothetical protein